MSDPVDIRYSVVRYVPDPVRQEVLNVGVVVAEGDALSAKLITPAQAGRLRALGYDRNLAFLRDLERDLNRGRLQEQTKLPEGQPAWTIADLESAAEKWGGTIQFSPLRPGRMLKGDDPVEVLFSKIVLTRAEIHRGPTRSTVKQRVRSGLVRILSKRYSGSDPKQLVHSGHRVMGKLEEHVFDYGVANGRPWHLVQTVSFDVDNRAALADELDATKWAVVDLSNARRKVPPLSIVAAGTRQKELREQAEHSFDKLNAPMFGEDEFDDWLDYVDETLPSTLRAARAGQMRTSKPRRRVQV